MYRIIALVVIMSSIGFSQVEESGLDIQGSLYGDFQVGHWVNPDSSDSAHFSGENVFKLNFRNRNRRYAKVDGAFELKMPYGYGISMYSDTSTSIVDSILLANTSDFVILSGNQTALLLDIRRLYLEMYFNKVEVSVGRKLINFGEGRIFSPIDKFSTLDITDYTFRKNAADVGMVRMNINNLWGVDVIAEIPYGEREQTNALKVFGTVGSFDLNLVGMFRSKSKQGIIGGAFKGDAEVGLYGEALFNFRADTIYEYGDAMLGVDYSIANKWLFVSEYQYLGYPDEHSLFFMANYTINELMAASANVIYNLTENNSIVTGYWSYNILQNADLVTYVQWYQGDAFDANPSVADLLYAIRIEVKF